jgi:hypothetical protein
VFEVQNEHEHVYVHVRVHVYVLVYVNVNVHVHVLYLGENISVNSVVRGDELVQMKDTIILSTDSA